MVRTYAFTTDGYLHSHEIEPFLIPTLLADTKLYLWVDLESPTEEEIRAFVETPFQFHALSIQDCFTTEMSPKVEEFLPREEDSFMQYIFMAVQAVDNTNEESWFETLRLNLFLGKRFVVTWRNRSLKSVEELGKKYRQRGAFIGRAPDRVAYQILDAVFDSYKPALDEITREISQLEESVLEKPTQETLNRIMQIKKGVRDFQTTILPQRDLLLRFARGEFKLIRTKLAPYYRDVYDELNHTSEMAKNASDSLTGLLQVYLSVSSNQTGEVVKLLTMITMITTPITLISGWYGMNFASMPEVAAPQGYPIALAVCIMATWLTYWYFKRRGWL